MAEKVELDEEGSYMARKMGEHIRLSPQRAARFAFMLTVHQLSEADDPYELAEKIFGLMEEDDQILQRLPRSVWPHDLVAKIITDNERRNGTP